MSKNLVKEYYILLPMTLLIFSIVIIIATLSTESWSKNNSSDLGLFRCTDCSELNPQWNFECLARSSCENQHYNECSLYTGLYRASYSFMIFEFASLLAGVILLEKLILIHFDYYAGPRGIIFALAISMPLLHILGTILWFALSDNSSLSRNDGSNLAIANCLLMSLMSGVFITLYLRLQNPQIPKEFNFKTFLKLKGELWMLFCLFYLLIGIVLLLSSLVAEDWIKYNETKGSLVRCEDCSSTQWLGWDCLQGTECAINSESKACKDLKNIHKASNGYIFIQAFTIVIICLFIQNLAGLIRGIDYGYHYANFAYAILMVMLNFISIVVWFGVSGAEILDDCKSNKICATEGPHLSIASNFLILAGTVTFCLAYKKDYPIRILPEESSFTKSGVTCQ